MFFKNSSSNNPITITVSRKYIYLRCLRRQFNVKTLALYVKVPGFDPDTKRKIKNDFGVHDFVI